MLRLPSPLIFAAVHAAPDGVVPETSVMPFSTATLSPLVAV